MASTNDRIASRASLEPLEPRRLLAATVTATQGEDGVIVITGTRRADVIAVVEHFPGLTAYDVIANGTLLGQFGGTAIRIAGRGGNDSLSVAGGITVPATILGEGGADTIVGGGGADLLDGGAGADALIGGAGADALFGRRGNDSLDGGDADDTFEGGAGRDVLLGGAGADVLLGGAGADTVNGGEGDDAVDGGGGRDLLTGGPGADLFASADRPAEITDKAPEDR